MPTATVYIREPPVYRREAFAAGLSACGYRVQFGAGKPQGRDDVFVTWNRYGDRHYIAQEFERAGCQVLVVENGYLGREWRDGIWYSISRNWHNTPQRYGGPQRWDSWGIELAPWREKGDHILVLPQRGIGEPPVKQPDGWLQQVLAWLKKNTKRPVRVRTHPGTAEPRPVDHGLLRDLENAYCVVTWASGAALKSLAQGFPCICGFREWIGASACSLDLTSLERPYLGDRLPMFRQLAWSIWNLEEISKGEPFKWLLPCKP